MKTYTVTLPCKPYVAKYVATVEKLIDGSPLQFTGKSMLCQILRAFMQNKPHLEVSKKRIDASVASRRSAGITIELPIRYLKKMGTEISPEGIYAINQFLESCFERALHKYMKDNVRGSGRYPGYSEAYQGFANLYNVVLEQDITANGLQRMYLRYQEAVDQNNFSGLVASFF